MPDTIGMAAQLGGNALRFGLYLGINRWAGWVGKGLGEQRPAYRPKAPVPTRSELFADMARLFLADAQAVGEGLYPPTKDEARAFVRELPRVQAMIADLPGAVERRQSGAIDSARTLADPQDLPAYYTQDFHFQRGGYLTGDSARLYDVQVETLFYGSANAMRRAALRPVAQMLRGRDQREVALLDVACGTGRLLRQLRLAFPALKLTGLDLSRSYLDEARRHMGALRPATLLEANAERTPLAAASQDIVTSVFLFHELPGDVRRRVSAEMARVLKPGGLLIFIDSLQLSDRPGWDGLLEAFPVRFHEPYFDHYIRDDLDVVFTEAGLAPVASRTIFLSKVMVRRRV